MNTRAPRAAGPGRRAIPLAMLLVAFAAAPMPAQEPEQAPAQTPDLVPKRGGGLWADAGASWAYMRLTSGQNLLNGQQIQGVTYAHGLAVTVTAGGALSSQVLLGLQVQQWQSAGAAVAQRVRSVLAVVQWYPWKGMGFFVRAGTGIVQGPVAASDTTTTTQLGTASGTGVAFAIGLGYDIPVTRHFELALQAATHINALGDLTRSGQTAYDVIAYVSRIGVALVYR